MDIDVWVSPQNFPKGRFGLYCGQTVVRTFDGVLNLTNPYLAIDESTMGVNIGLLTALELEIGGHWKPSKPLPAGKVFSIKKLPFMQFAEYVGEATDTYYGSVFMRTPTGFLRLNRHQDTWGNELAFPVRPLPVGTSLVVRFK